MRRFSLVLLPVAVLALALSAAAPAKKAVAIKDMKFVPATIDVSAGDTVRWTNNDVRDHTVTAADGSFKSGNLRAGDTFEHTFETTGKFAYACSYHPRMKGTVNVGE